MTDVQKFDYLKAQLQNEALRTIAGFALTNANYADAIILLKERFGQTEKITQAYIQALLEIPSPRNHLISLRQFYNQIETYVRGLESLGQSQDSYGTLLVPIILKKLPGEIKKNLAREHGTENCNIAHDNDTSRHIQQNANDSPQNTNFPISNGHLQYSPNLNQTSVNIVNDTNQKEEDTTILHSSSNDVRTHVLLKTAVAPVWSDNLCVDTHILFDEGSQRSFVTEDLARKLNLHTEGIEILQVSSFGDKNKNVRHLDKSTVFVESNAGQKIPIHVLIVPMIAVPLQNNIRHINRGLIYLRGLKLAHPVTQEESFEISLLIGADYYWDLVENEVLGGDDLIYLTEATPN
ncbi:uncharacterized protein [Mytilus edulis]|uniref:uncharacterized protein n=1 Tax=Mytilus edulis TaxID=6550 RepID=UPI0039EFCCD9